MHKQWMRKTQQMCSRKLEFSRVVQQCFPFSTPIVYCHPTWGTPSVSPVLDPGGPRSLLEQVTSLRLKDVRKAWGRQTSLWKTGSGGVIYPNSEKRWPSWRHSRSSSAQPVLQLQVRPALFLQLPLLIASLAKVYQQVGRILSKATWLFWQYALLWSHLSLFYIINFLG